jgi:hypothetical protein
MLKIIALPCEVLVAICKSLDYNSLLSFSSAHSVLSFLIKDKKLRKRYWEQRLYRKEIEPSEKLSFTKRSLTKALMKDSLYDIKILSDLLLKEFKCFLIPSDIFHLANSPHALEIIWDFINPIYLFQDRLLYGKNLVERYVFEDRLDMFLKLKEKCYTHNESRFKEALKFSKNEETFCKFLDTLNTQKECYFKDYLNDFSFDKLKGFHDYNLLKILCKCGFDVNRLPKPQEYAHIYFFMKLGYNYNVLECEISIAIKLLRHFKVDFRGKDLMGYVVARIAESLISNEEMHWKRGPFDAMFSVPHLHEFMELVLECEFDPNSMTEAEQTFLHIAVKCGYYDLIPKFIEKGVDKNKRDIYGREFLYFLNYNNIDLWYDELFNGQLYE